MKQSNEMINMLFRRKSEIRVDSDEHIRLMRYHSLLKSQALKLEKKFIWLDNLISSQYQLQESSCDKINQCHQPVKDILKEASLFRKGSLASIEKQIQYSFKEWRILFPFFIRKDLKQLFTDISNIGILSAEQKLDFDEIMEWFNQQRDVLAMIGDGAIDMALYHNVLLKNPTKSIDVALLNGVRERKSSNRALSLIFDIWEMNDLWFPSIPYMDSFFVNSEKQKGTVIEGLFGIIYLENDFDTFINITINSLTIKE